MVSVDNKIITYIKDLQDLDRVQVLLLINDTIYSYSLKELLKLHKGD